MLTVGQFFLGPLEDQTIRMVSGFAGGMGRSRQEACGAVSSGVLIISGLYGRIDPEVDDTYCLELCNRYLHDFEQSLGSTRCHILQASGYGPKGHTPCSVLVECAARMLLDLLGENPE